MHASLLQAGCIFSIVLFVGCRHLFCLSVSLTSFVVFIHWLRIFCRFLISLLHLLIVPSLLFHALVFVVAEHAFIFNLFFWLHLHIVSNYFANIRACQYGPVNLVVIPVWFVFEECLKQEKHILSLVLLVYQELFVLKGVKQHELDVG